MAQTHQKPQTHQMADKMSDAELRENLTLMMNQHIRVMEAYGTVCAALEEQKERTGELENQVELLVSKVETLEKENKKLKTSTLVTLSDKKDDLYDNNTPCFFGNGGPNKSDYHSSFKSDGVIIGAVGGAAAGFVAGGAAGFAYGTGTGPGVVVTTATGAVAGLVGGAVIGAVAGLVGGAVIGAVAGSLYTHRKID